MALLIVICIFATGAIAAETRKPNIIFILADDLSSHSIGVYGGKKYSLDKPEKPEDVVGIPVRTPHLDRMAKEGLRFDNVLAAPVCSPSRGIFLTGKYNFRLGLPDVVGRGGSVTELDVTSNVTLPQILQQHGYLTAMAGKWHLSKNIKGDLMAGMSPTLKDNPAEHITQAEFERQYIHSNGMALRYYIDKETGGFMADWIQEWTLKFLDEKANAQRPFFLYYALPMPHSPWGPLPKPGETLNPPIPNGPNYFPDHVTRLDGYVGQVLDKLNELGIAKNTLVIFSGDNGSEGPFTIMEDDRVTRGGKFQFGQNARVPLIAWWPDTIHAGGTRDDLVDFSDFLPTLLDVAGITAHPTDMDGVSFKNALLGKTGSAREWILSHRLDSYIVREYRYGLREGGNLYDLTEQRGAFRSPIPKEAMSPEQQALREKLRAVVKKYNLPVAEKLGKSVGAGF